MSNIYRYFVTASGTVMLLVTLACGRSQAPVSMLHDEPATLPAKPLDPSMEIVGRLEDKSLVLRIGAYLHPVTNCATPDDLAKILEINIPGDELTVVPKPTEESLGRTLSCSGTAVATNAQYSKTKDRYKIPIGNISKASYVFKVRQTKCRNPVQIMKLFGITHPYIGTATDFDFNATVDPVIDCTAPIIKLLSIEPSPTEAPGDTAPGETDLAEATLLPNTAIKPIVDPSLNYNFQIGDTLYPVVNCNKSEILKFTATFGLTPKLEKIETMFSGILVENKKLKLGRTLNCKLPSAPTGIVYEDAAKKLTYISAGSAGEYYYLDISLQSRCPLRVDLLKLMVGGIKATVNGKPKFSTPAKPLDCELLNGTYNSLGRFKQKMRLNGATEFTDVNVIVLGTTYGSATQSLYFYAHNNVPFTKNDGERIVVRELSDKYFAGEFDSINELSEVGADLTHRPTLQSPLVLLDTCVGECKKTFVPKHKILNNRAVANDARFPLSEKNLVSSQIQVNEVGDYDYSVTEADLLPGSTGISTSLNFQSCLPSLLDMVGVEITKIDAVDDWNSHWKSFYGVGESIADVPKTNQRTFNCQGLKQQKDCSLAISGAFKTVDLNSKLSTAMNSCKGTRFDLELKGSVTLDGDIELRTDFNSGIEEFVIWAKEKETQLHFVCSKPNCVRAASAIRSQVSAVGSKSLKTLELRNVRLSITSPRDTGLTVSKNNLRLIDSTIEGLSGRETGLPRGLLLTDSDLYCLRCKISGDLEAIKSTQSNLLITEGLLSPIGESVATFTTISSSTGSALNLDGGSQAFLYGANVETNTSIKISASPMQNPSLVLKKTTILNKNVDLKTLILARFKAIFKTDAGLNLRAKDGEVEINESKIRALPSDGKNFSLMSNFGTAVEGDLKIDYDTEFYRLPGSSVISEGLEGEIIKEFKIDTLDSLKSLVRCNELELVRVSAWAEYICPI